MTQDIINLQVIIVLYQVVTLPDFMLKDQYFEIPFSYFEKISNIDGLHSSYIIIVQKRSGSSAFQRLQTVNKNFAFG